MNKLLEKLIEVESYKYDNGDEIPNELCDIIKSSQCLMLCTLLGIIMPDPITFFTGPLVGISMYNSDIKKKVIRYIANNFSIRFKNINEENVIRLEINIGLENWLPLFIFNINNIIFENESIVITQLSDDKLFGPITSYAEEILRSNTVNKISSYIENIIENNDNKNNDLYITHTFNINNDILIYTIKIIKNNNIIANCIRNYII
tara:strand:+ start:1904 stop:2518 length:615 start_codon:yes stop_codon:yes gene_type:complete